MRYGVVEMFPLLCVEVLELSGVLVLALVGHVSPQVELRLGLDKTQTNIRTTTEASANLSSVRHDHTKRHTHTH